MHAARHKNTPSFLGAPRVPLIYFGLLVSPTQMIFIDKVTTDTTYTSDGMQYTQRVRYMRKKSGRVQLGGAASLRPRPVRPLPRPRRLTRPLPRAWVAPPMGSAAPAALSCCGGSFSADSPPAPPTAVGGGVGGIGPGCFVGGGGAATGSTAGGRGGRGAAPLGRLRRARRPRSRALPLQLQLPRARGG